jgi:hypothetical protein
MSETHVDIQLDREDVILMLVEANERIHRRAFLSGVTRLEKLVYLLEQETRFEGIARFFPFVAHNFGPFSKEVYEAVDFLEGCGLLEVREKSYGSAYAAADEAGLASEIGDDEDDVEVKEKEFRLTDNGRVVARKMREAVQARRPSDVKELDGIVLKYGAWQLRQLIRYVYRQYPGMTVNSIHPEAQRVQR